MDKKLKPFIYIGYILLIACFISWVSYSQGMKQGIEKQKRPVYVRQSDFTTENIKKYFIEAKITATAEQIEVFGRSVREGGKNAR